MITGKYVVSARQNQGSYSSWNVRGFENKAEAYAYADAVIERIGWGYSPSFNVTEKDGEVIVYFESYNSCD